MGNSAGIRSMTGYGQATAELGQVRLWVEARSLNHRFADLRLRLPPGLAGEEQELRPAGHAEDDCKCLVHDV